MDNLFLILRAYLSNTYYVIRNIYTITEPKNEKIVFLQSLNKNKLNKCSYSEFSIYYSEFIETDEKYVEEGQIYGVRISFYKNSPFFLTNISYPKYPWGSFVYKSLISKYEDQSSLIKRLRISLMHERWEKKKILQSIYTKRNRVPRKKISSK